MKKQENPHSPHEESLIPLAMYEEYDPLFCKEFDKKNVDVVIGILESVFDPGLMQSHPQINQLLLPESPEGKLMKMFWYVYHDMESRDASSEFVYNFRQQEWESGVAYTTPSVPIQQLVEAYPAIFYILTHCRRVRDEWPGVSCSHDQMLRRWSRSVLTHTRTSFMVRADMLLVLARAERLEYVEDMESTIAQIELYITRYDPSYQSLVGSNLSLTVALVGVMEQYLKEVLLPEYPVTISSRIQDCEPTMRYSYVLFEHFCDQLHFNPFRGYSDEVLVSLRHATHYFTHTMCFSSDLLDKKDERILRAIVIVSVLQYLRLHTDIIYEKKSYQTSFPDMSWDIWRLACKGERRCYLFWGQGYNTLAPFLSWFCLGFVFFTFFRQLTFGKYSVKKTCSLGFSCWCVGF
jgi:hypothetical protein